MAPNPMPSYLAVVFSASDCPLTNWLNKLRSRVISLVSSAFTFHRVSDPIDDLYHLLLYVAGATSTWFTYLSAEKRASLWPSAWIFLRHFRKIKSRLRTYVRYKEHCFTPIWPSWILWSTSCWRKDTVVSLANFTQYVPKQQMDLVSKWNQAQ